jgi:hypothetical protein
LPFSWLFARYNYCIIRLQNSGGQENLSSLKPTIAGFGQREYHSIPVS